MAKLKSGPNAAGEGKTGGAFRTFRSSFWSKTQPLRRSLNCSLARRIRLGVRAFRLFGAQRCMSAARSHDQISMSRKHCNSSRRTTLPREKSVDESSCAERRIRRRSKPELGLILRFRTKPSAIHRHVASGRVECRSPRTSRLMLLLGICILAINLELRV
jgi:hypothetical protein